MKNLLTLLTAMIGSTLFQNASIAAPRDELFKDYLQVQSLLAQDTFAGVTEAAKKLTTDATTLKESALAKDSEQLSKSKDIDEARDHFAKVSARIIPIAKKAKSKDREIVYCPMKKARWVQAKGDIKNPYYGKEMLECGVIE